MTLVFRSEVSHVELFNGFSKSFLEAKPISYKFVKDGPILENVQMGDEVNVLSFPTPFWHENDGGRYIGTGSYNITWDPADGRVNG